MVKLYTKLRNVALVAALSVAVSGCGGADVKENVKETKKETEKKSSVTGSADITFNGDSINVDGTGVSANGTVVTISGGGEYTFTGSLDSGQIVIDADSDVTLVLAGMSICNEKENTLNIKNGDVTLRLMENTENTFISGIEESSEVTEEKTETEEDTAGAAIYAKDDLTITGDGTLIVNGYVNNGIQSKDKLCIENGTITVCSVNDGIKGKESIAISGGVMNVTSGGDGIQSDADMELTGGEFRIVSGGGSPEMVMQNGMSDNRGFRMGEPPTGEKREEMGEPPTGDERPERGQKTEDKGGRVSQQNQNTENEDSNTISTKGVKAEGVITISGGVFDIDSYDDAIHSNKKIVVDAGNFTINSGDDGIHAEEELRVNNGDIKIEKCNEGLEAVKIEINEGNLDITSADDGLNANEEGSDLIINAGKIFINAEGDGIDSNGDININGGDITINGSSNSGNSAIDCGTESGGKCIITGGNVVAAGCSGMAESFDSESSKQCSVLYIFDTQLSSGTEIRIADESGNVIQSYTTVKNGDSVIFSSPELELGKTYTVTAGEQNGTITITENAVSNKTLSGGMMRKKGW